LRKIALVIMISLLALLSGCVSEEKYERDILELEQELEELKQDRNDLEEEYQALEDIVYSSYYPTDAETAALIEQIETHLATISDLNATILLLEASLLEMTSDHNEAVEELEYIYVLIEDLEADFTEFMEDYIALLLMINDLPEIETFMHINGHGFEEEYVFTIMHQYELIDYVKYQITYLSCTSRNVDVNYWQVAYVEINKITNDIRFISFDEDSAGHYSPGSWGDSDPTPSGKTFEDFETDFIPWLIGKDLSSLDGISVFKNVDYHGIQNTTNIPEQDLIDSFAGSSVSTNNMIRVMKSLLEYHEEKYND